MSTVVEGRRLQQSVEDMIDQYRRNFSSVWRCFEYLLYAIVGNFETDVRRCLLNFKGQLNVMLLGLPSLHGRLLDWVDYFLLFALRPAGSYRPPQPSDLRLGRHVRPGDDARRGGSDQTSSADDFRV